MRKPRISDSVWVHRLGSMSDQPEAGIVVYVHSDTVVQVTVFTSAGRIQVASSLFLQQPDGPQRDADTQAWCEYPHEQ